MNEQKVHELWGHFHWLNVLAQQGSYTAAAARLGVSKAAVSQRMAELERLAGVALVQRTTRSVRLTEAGQRLADQARPAFEQIAQSVAQVRDLAGAPRGLVRLTAPVAFARQQPNLQSHSPNQVGRLRQWSYRRRSGGAPAK